FYYYCAHQDLHSFPTRRSSDLVGIAASVPSFMMMADQRQHAVQRRQRPADLFTTGRMGTHDLPLFGVQFAWLEEHGIGDADLPRSEEHTSELQSLAYLVCRLLL